MNIEKFRPLIRLGILSTSRQFLTANRGPHLDLTLINSKIQLLPINYVCFASKSNSGGDGGADSTTNDGTGKKEPPQKKPRSFNKGSGGGSGKSSSGSGDDSVLRCPKCGGASNLDTQLACKFPNNFIRPIGAPN